MIYSQKYFSFIFFRLLDYVENTISFIGLSLILRIVASIGATCGYISVYSIAAALCPSDVGSIMVSISASALFIQVSFFIWHTLSVSGDFYYIILYRICCGTNYRRNFIRGNFIIILYLRFAV